MRYLLDTNVAGHVLRGDLPAIRARLFATPLQSVAVSVVTEAELRYGVEKRGQPAALRRLVDEFLVRVTVRDWTSACASSWSTLRVATEAAGTPLAPLDLMIAAQAMAEDLILVTRDRAFGRVPGLRLEDWSQ